MAGGGQWRKRARSGRLVAEVGAGPIVRHLLSDRCIALHPEFNDRAAAADAGGCLGIYPANAGANVKFFRFNCHRIHYA